MEEKRITIGQEIHRIDHMIDRYLLLRVRASGMDENTLMHGWIMRYLYENRERDIYQKDIEKAFSIGRSTVTGIIQLLERKGYVCRESVACDARLKKVMLTDVGIKNNESIRSIISAMDQMLEEGIEEEEFRVFYRVLDKIKENLKKNYHDNKKEGLYAADNFATSKRV